MRLLLITLILAAAALPANAQHARNVKFSASDGHKPLYADYYPPRPGTDNAPIVILLHMYKSDKSTWQPLVPYLQNAGFAVMAIDMRGHGRKPNPETRKRVRRRDPEVFEEMAYDVQGAYEWLVEQPNVDPSRFALVGASVGCSVALRYATMDASVDAVVCLTPGTDYMGLDSVADAEKLKGRSVMLMASEQERKAVDTLAPLIENAKSKIYDTRGRAHGTGLFGKAAHVEDDIAKFLQFSVGDPTDNPVYFSIRSENGVYHTSDSEWVKKISKHNLRVLSSTEEAKTRGLRKSYTKAPLDDDD